MSKETVFTNGCKCHITGASSGVLDAPVPVLTVSSSHPLMRGVMPLCEIDMNAMPPREICEMPVLRFAQMGPKVAATGNTIHTVNGRPAGPISALAICDGGGTPQSFYLFSCDADWNVITDTHHLSIDEALNQASFEYNNIHSAWQQPKHG